MARSGWQRCSSSAIDAYRYLPEREVLELVFAEGQTVYDYPCSELLYDEFLRAPSKGRFVVGVLKPHAQSRGWTQTPRPFSGF